MCASDCVPHASEKLKCNTGDKAAADSGGRSSAVAPALLLEDI